MNLEQLSVTACEREHFQKAILNWYDNFGRTTLPWRQQISDYRVWLSEVMLQQTQVKTVIPYFERFLNHFATIAELANAERDSVLSLWSGLGYYTRARNLHSTAAIITNDYQERFPKCANQLQALPGIGRSTAHAILAISHDLPYAILDGNVKRVLARVFCIDSPINQTKTLKELWQASESLVPSYRPRDYTQAVMDLGATVCTRSKPRCNECPVSNLCLAHKKQLTDIIPTKVKRKALPLKYATYALIVNEDKEVLLQKRPDSGLWSGLWQLPEIAPNDAPSFHSLKHTFSHFQLQMEFKNLAASAYQKQQNQQWFNEQGLQNIGLPKPFGELLRQHFYQQAIKDEALETC